MNRRQRIDPPSRARRAARRLPGALLAVLLVACGEPDVDLSPPPRAAGAQLHDEVGVVDPAVAERLAAVSEASGLDVVGLVYEDERATLGQADRAGRLLLEAWDADIVLVAVAFPGDFANPDPDARQRFFGVASTDRFTVTRDLRERIVDEAVPPPAAANDWTAAFEAAVDELAADLG